ncbi:hypothetical protein LTV02_11535 [Nocardia yamanashiensis]|uniref:hypothetical protein n=1 Tax=Nocardia yamanashiensis TaxID=209247 RepID=UPI001E455B21|nr:hypothetical protein [Nocardia yamanashiensis]UGT43971.1 hypothetical protein LTV02_11535 [Nocardia yamanashiensis]
MRAGTARSSAIAAIAAIAVPLVALTAPSASAQQPTPAADQPTAVRAGQPFRVEADAPYISITICVHIPTPGSATLDWCWP